MKNMLPNLPPVKVLQAYKNPRQVVQPTEQEKPAHTISRLSSLDGQTYLTLGPKLQQVSGGLSKPHIAIDPDNQAWFVKKMRFAHRKGKNSTTYKTHNVDYNKALKEIQFAIHFGPKNQVIKIYEAANKLYMQMPLRMFDAQTFMESITQDKDRYLVAWHLLFGAAQTLKMMAEQDIIHGDVKLPNVLCSEDGTFELADFNLCTSTSSSSDSRYCGTVGYIAPERLIEVGLIDPRADIWSLGVTLLSVLLPPQVNPFVRDEETSCMERKNQTAWTRRILRYTDSGRPTTELRFKDRLDNHLLRLSQDEPKLYHLIVHRMLQVDPAKRSTAAQLCELAQNHMQDNNLAACLKPMFDERQKLSLTHSQQLEDLRRYHHWQARLMDDVSQRPGPLIMPASLKVVKFREQNKKPYTWDVAQLWSVDHKRLLLTLGSRFDDNTLPHRSHIAVNNHRQLFRVALFAKPQAPYACELDRSEVLTGTAAYVRFATEMRAGSLGAPLLLYEATNDFAAVYPYHGVSGHLVNKKMADPTTSKRMRTAVSWHIMRSLGQLTVACRDSGLLIPSVSSGDLLFDAGGRCRVMHGQWQQAEQAGWPACLDPQWPHIPPELYKSPDAPSATSSLFALAGAAAQMLLPREVVVDALNLRLKSPLLGAKPLASGRGFFYVRYNRWRNICSEQATPNVVNFQRLRDYIQAPPKSLEATSLALLSASILRMDSCLADTLLNGCLQLEPERRMTPEDLIDLANDRLADEDGALCTSFFADLQRYINTDKLHGYFLHKEHGQALARHSYESKTAFSAGAGVKSHVRRKSI